MTNANRLVEIATAYWHSATLMSAIQLRLPTLIEGGCHTVDALAEATNADGVALMALLEGLCALEILERKNDKFYNGDEARLFLVEDRPTFMGSALLYNADVYPKWGSLTETIRQGAPVHSPELYLGNQEEQTRNFVYGMHHRALSVGRMVIDALDLDGRTHLCDLGGGPGTYSAMLTNKFEGLRATVLDLPGVTKHARHIVAGMPAGDRVQCHDFDYYTDEIEFDYDAALISGVLHREQLDGVQKILAKVCASLKPGGVLYISDVMLNDDRTGPLFSTMFSLNMRVLAHNGRAHSVMEQTKLLEALGLQVTQTHQLDAPIHYTLIKAVK